MPRLVDVLTELLRATGAVYLGVLDTTTAGVLGEVGDVGEAGRRHGADEPREAAVRLMADAQALARCSGEVLDDVTVASGRTFAVARRIGASDDGDVVLYAVLRRGRGTVAATRRELAMAGLHDRIRAALGADAGPGPPTGRGARRPTSPGEVPLPRRRPGAGVADVPRSGAAGSAGLPTVLRQPWANDPVALRTLLSGLRRMG